MSYASILAAQRQNYMNISLIGWSHLGSLIVKNLRQPWHKYIIPTRTPSIFCSPTFHPSAQSCGLICNNRVFESSQKKYFLDVHYVGGCQMQEVTISDLFILCTHFPLSLCHPSKLWEYTSRTEAVSGNWLFIWIWYENILFCIRVYFYLRHWFPRDDWW